MWTPPSDEAVQDEAWQPPADEAIDVPRGSSNDQQVTTPEQRQQKVVESQQGYPEFSKQFTQQAEGNPLKKLWGLATSNPVGEILGNLGEKVVSGVESIPEMVRTSIVPGNYIKSQANLGGNIYQTIAEAGGRFGYDVLNTARDILGNNPLETLDKFINPLGAAMNYLRSYTPSKDEIQSAYEQFQKGKDYTLDPYHEVVPKIFGEANPKLADAIKEIAPLVIPMGEGAPSARLVLNDAGKLATDAWYNFPKRAPTSDSLITHIINPPAWEGKELGKSGEIEAKNFINNLENGQTQNLFQNFKKSSTSQDLKGLIVGGEKRSEKLGQKTEDFFRNDPNVKLLKLDGNEAAEAALSALDTSTQSPTQIKHIRGMAERLQGDLSLSDAQKELSDINARRKPILESVGYNRTEAMKNPQYAADEMVRRVLSNRIDETIRGHLGVENNFFREYGQTQGLLEDLKGRYSILKNAQLKGVVTEPGLLQRIAMGTGKAWATLSGKTIPDSLIKQYAGRELSKVDESVRSLFKILPQPAPPIPLSDAARKALLKGKTFERLPQVDQPSPNPVGSLIKPVELKGPRRFMPPQTAREAMESRNVEIAKSLSKQPISTHDPYPASGPVLTPGGLPYTYPVPKVDIKPLMEHQKALQLEYQKSINLQNTTPEYRESYSMAEPSEDVVRKYLQRSGGDPVAARELYRRESA